MTGNSRAEWYLDKLNRIENWWVKQPVWLRGVTGIGVLVVIILLVTGFILFNRRPTEAKTVDTSEEIYRTQSNKRVEGLEKSDVEGATIVTEADRKIEGLDREGAIKSTERSVRDAEILDADNWADLNNELGAARWSGRKTDAEGQVD